MLCEDYKQATIRLIRDRCPQLADKNEAQLELLYTHWSIASLYAHWLTPTDTGIAAFCEWATTPPCEYDDYQNL